MPKKPPDPFVHACLMRLAPLGPVRARAMFGGHGIYCEDKMFALVAEGALYFKVDDQSRRAFEAVGAQPFVYMAKHRPMSLSYWRLPPEKDADERTFLEFAGHGLAAARRKTA
ncbi:MAG: TfoX/Sxy family protein [Rhodothalassiaceae bacterium]